MFNLKTLAVADTSELHLRSATDELLYDATGKPLTITVFGPGSKAYAKAASAQQNRMIDKLKRKGRSEQTPEQKAQEQADFLASITVSFTNFEYGSGLNGFDMYQAAYADTEIGFIAEQVGKHVGDWANFTKTSAKK
ncbi:MAG: hypothetical protein PHV02_08630 [Rhodocyclaceae bacterium]|nr:hypothetical protein [Rhodocyclaceae bacterium]